jgi:hypothetical protein
MTLFSYKVYIAFNGWKNFERVRSWRILRTNPESETTAENYKKLGQLISDLRTNFCLLRSHVV